VPSLARRVSALAALARLNYVPFERPDRLPRALAATLPWGLGTAAGVAAAVARYPRAVALVDDDGPVTYEALWRQSDGIAHRLLTLGAGPDVGVGVLCRNHRGFVAAALAATKTAADLVLLNTGFGAPQLAAVMRAEGVRVLVHDDEFTDVVAAPNGVSGPARLDERALAVAAASGQRPPSTRRPGRTVILTSGTTGPPKGATRTPDLRALDGVPSLLGRMPLRARDVVVDAAPMFHAWGFAHLVMGLGRSATIVMSRRFEAGATLDAVAHHRARVVVLVPVMLQRILALDRRRLAAADTSSLAIIASGGSSLGGRLATETLNRFGPVLYNTYGSTEVAVASVATPRDLVRHPTTVGRPAPGVRVELLDDEGQLVNRGEIGRIFVGNAARFDGYTSGPSKESRRGLLASGDVGHVDEEGFLYVDGREDDMIISGGENVYPSEVQELLSRHPAVAEVAVVGVPDEEFGQALAAFVVVRDRRTITGEEVRAFVRDHLARFKVPRRVVFLDELPRTPTGKVLTRQLDAM
jgi:fatty-acyl-CoA synthase